MQNVSTEFDVQRWFGEEPGGDWSLLEEGAYAYARSSACSDVFEPSGVQERYAHFLSRDGTQRYARSYRDARNTPAEVLLQVESWAGEAGTTEVALGLRGPMGERTVRYEIEGNQLRVHRSPGERLPVSLALPEGCVFLPLTRNYLGAVLRELAAREGGRGAVLVPELEDPGAATALEPLISHRQVLLADEGAHTIATAGQAWNTVPYGFTGGPYDHRSVFWVCRDSGRLVRYAFASGSGERWSCELVESHAR